VIFLKSFRTLLVVYKASITIGHAKGADLDLSSTWLKWYPFCVQSKVLCFLLNSNQHLLLVIYFFFFFNPYSLWIFFLEYRRTLESEYFSKSAFSISLLKVINVLSSLFVFCSMKSTSGITLIE